MNKILLALYNLIILSSLCLYAMEQSSSDLQIINNTNENFYILLTSADEHERDTQIDTLVSNITGDSKKTLGRSLKPGGIFNITNYTSQNSIQGNFQDKVSVNPQDLAIISNYAEVQKVLNQPGTKVITLQKQLKAPWYYVGTPITDFTIDAKAVSTPLKELIELEEGKKVTQQPEYKEEAEKALAQLKRASIDPRIQEVAREPFMIAIRQQDKNAVISFLQAGIDPNFTDPSGQTPLISALASEAFDIAKLLIENNADVNVQNEDKMTPLMALLTTKETDQSRVKEIETLVRLLLNKHADTNLKNNLGQTALDLARYNYSDNPTLITLLEQHSK